MKRRSFIKRALSALGITLTGSEVIGASELVPNPMFGVTTYLKPWSVHCRGVDCELDVTGGYGGVFEVPISEHPNWEILKEKYGAFINADGEYEFPPLIPEYRTGEPELDFVEEDDPEEGWWKTSEEWDAEMEQEE